MGRDLFCCLLLRVRVLGVSLALLALAPAAAAAFDFEELSGRARRLAEEPFREGGDQVPKWLLKISYDQWRDIRFRPERSLWRKRNLPFEVRFFHPGFYYDHVVAVNVVDAEGVHPVRFSPSDFDYGRNKFASRVPQDLGYAGFRIHYPIKRRDYKDEVAVFLGASYFRAVGRDQGFGLSARGLAVDTALPSGEEFPYFREFWLVRPTRTARSLAVYALLDSRRLTGAYRFAIRPGVQTVINVKARLFLREPVDRLGIAPLTSMFFHGENTRRFFDDFRPEVHDSDGLLVAYDDGEWLWRPVDNPPHLQVTTFHAASPKGFGLVQRDRAFDHYQDLETRPDLRPSAWVVPSRKWGEGEIVLVEIPTHAEYNDNIVAFWVPAKLPDVGEPVRFSYAVYWYGDDPNRPPGGRAIATRRDRGRSGDLLRFVIDFAGKRLAALPAETVLRAVVTVGSGDDGRGELLEQQVVKNPEAGGWRLVFQVRPRSGGPLELRAFLQRDTDVLTETWSYVIEP